MKPMAPMERWWPEGLGSPAAAGSQNGLRYAFFPQARRLLVDGEGGVQAYDSGDHQISGVAQASGGRLAFTSQHGQVDLDTLKPAAGG